MSTVTDARIAKTVNKSNRSWQSSLWLPILAGLILSFAYPRMDFWPLAWIALVPYWIFLDSAPNRWLAFLGTFLFSFTFFAISVHWIRFVTLFGWSFVVVFESLFYMAMGLLAWELLHRRSCKVCFSDNLTVLAALPALWVLAEWARSEVPVMGFGWNLLAYSQTDNLNLIQISKWIGAYGVSFLVALGNSFLFLLWRLVSAYGSPARRFLILGSALTITLLIFVGTIRFGFASLGREIQGPVFRVALVQGNIPQEDKWDPKLKNAIVDKYVKLSELASYDGPDLVIWPEAAYPGYFNLDRNGELRDAVGRLGVPFLVGALTAESETLFYNSVYWLSDDGETIGRYDKINLVPFGEYIPFQFVLYPLESLARQLGVSDFSSGRETKVFRIPVPEWKKQIAEVPGERAEAAIGPLICFENMFQNLVRELAWKGAQVLCVMTNDAWFLESSAPYQHLQASVFRAVETGRWVLHCANTGVSAFVSPKGEVVDRIKDEKGRDLFVMGGLTRPIFIQAENTFYLRYGYLFPYLALLIVAQGFLFSRRKKGSSLET